MSQPKSHPTKIFVQWQPMARSRLIDLESVHKQIQAIASFLDQKKHRDPATGRVGWHNVFESRIGTTGSAVPLLFLERAGFPCAETNSIIDMLVATQTQTSASVGGWSILSLTNVVTVEATAWCLVALARCGGPTSRPAIHRAELWLKENQAADGGWGSDLRNHSRTLTTAQALTALCALSARERDVVTRGVSWLDRAQRPDGSWGPKPGDDGTVFHTALIVHSLCELSLSSRTDSRITRAIAWLAKEWTPGANRWQDETYEVHVSNGSYNKIPLVHDTDAQVVRALLSASDSRLVGMIGDGILALQKAYELHGVSAIGTRSSVWTIVPAGLAMSEFLDHSIAATHGTMFFLPSHVGVTSERVRRVGPLLAAALVQQLTRDRWKSFFVVLAVMVVIALACLRLTNVIDNKELLLSVGVEFVGGMLSVFVERKFR
jgi:hypothetical protein